MKNDTTYLEHILTATQSIEQYLKGVKSYNDFKDNKMLIDLASMMKKILLKLKEINHSYNFFLHYSPEGEDLHFNIEICPRRAIWAGFELSSGEIINSVSPEDAAKFYRGEE